MRGFAEGTASVLAGVVLPALLRRGPLRPRLRGLSQPLRGGGRAASGTASAGPNLGTKKSSSLFGESRGGVPRKKEDCILYGRSYLDSRRF